VDGFLDRGRRLASENRDAQGYRDFRQARAMAELQGLPDAELDRILRTAVAACPRQPGAHYDYGLFLADRGRDGEALDAFRRAVALAPQWVSGYLGLAEIASRTGRYEAAEAALARALRLDPGHREAQWGMAVLYDQGLHRQQDAVDAYRSFLTRNPNDARADQARQRIRDLESGLRPEPRPTMRITPPAVRPPPTLDIPKPRTRNKRTAIEAFNRGAAAQTRGDWSQAIAQYTRALEHDDTFTAAFYNLGVAYHNQGNTGLAREAYRHCIQRDRCHVNSRFNLALLDREQGDPHAAVNQLKELLLCDAQHARSHYVLGLLYAENLSRNDLAAAHFRQFLRLSPRDPAASSVRDWLNTHP
jgi:tetratricopeptide (TPR) repeat protein